MTHWNIHVSWDDNYYQYMENYPNIPNHQQDMHTPLEITSLYAWHIESFHNSYSIINGNIHASVAHVFLQVFPINSLFH